MVEKDPRLFPIGNWMNDSVNKCRNISELYVMEMHVVNDSLIEELLQNTKTQSDKQAILSLMGPAFIEEHYPGMSSVSNRDINDYDQNRHIIEMVDDALRKRLKKYKEEAKKSRSRSLHTLDSKISRIFSEDLDKEILKSGVPSREVVCQSIKDLLSTGYEAQKMLANETRKKIVMLPPEIRVNFFEMFDLLSRTKCRRRNVQLFHDYGDFFKTLQMAMKREGISSVLDWKEGRKEIDEEVILTYEKNKLRHIKITDESLYHYVKILIILKLTNGDFSTAHIYWLIKGHNYFPDPNATEPLSAFYFHKLLDYAVFGRDMIFKTAENVEALLKKYDLTYYKQINSSLESIPMNHLDPDVFPKEVILKDEVKCTEFWLKYQQKNHRLSTQTEAEPFRDLKIYFRKWLSEAFVGCCSETGSSLIWDVLFVNEFRKATIINVCYTLIYLLKHFVEDGNIRDRRIHDILIEGPRVLYTSDIRRVLKYLEGNRYNYDKIPGLHVIPVLNITPPSPKKKE